MKTAIKLVLIYFGIQILSAFAVVIPAAIYNAVQDHSIEEVGHFAIALSMFLAFIFMAIYLWKDGYIGKDKRTWSAISGTYLLFSVLICLASIFIIDYLHTLLPKLPNLLDSTFDTLQSGWLGILSIAVFGPVLEELLFRGAITKVLLKTYSPAKAIILSALVFGVFHINPAQIIVGMLFGLVLGWIYYKTASLIPCILIHMLNNSLAVYLDLKFPDAENMNDLFVGNTYFILLIAAILLFTVSVLWMKRIPIPFPWKAEAMEIKEDYKVKTEE